MEWNWYTGNVTFDTVLTIGFAFAIFTAIASLFIPSPYGRFGDSKKYGLSVSPRLGWFLMELPATLVFIYFFFQGQNAFEIVPLLFLLIWLMHYANRGFIQPYLMRTPKGAKSTFSFMVISIGWVVTAAHAYLNASWIAHYGEHLTIDWLWDPRFLFGIVLYYTGLGINLHADGVIRNLRTREEVEAGIKKYRIPKGGLYKFISNPNYFGEIIAWTGFAIFTWGLGGVFILAVTMANLIPRAFLTHKWYKEKFADYPKERKALIPFIA